MKVSELETDPKKLLCKRISEELQKKEVKLEDTIVERSDAIKLHQLGFNESCCTYYGEVNGGELWAFQRNFNEKEFNLGILAPSYDQALSFLKRVYGIKGCVTHAESNGTWTFKTHKWNCDNNVGKWEYITNVSSYESKRLAEIACFKKVFELVQERLIQLGLTYGTQEAI